MTSYTGATAILMYRFDPMSVLQAIDRYQVSHWYSIAPMNVAVMQVRDARKFNLKSLRINPCISFGITLTLPAETLSNRCGPDSLRNHRP